jgi:small subunit ribosomal protein S4
MKLFLKGERCLTEKCAIERRAYPPGQHGRGRIKSSEYLLQLREKQKARRYYGVLERQFRTYYERASRRQGITGDNLLRLLETRLDNVVFRMGFATSRAQARQIVAHGHFAVNGHVTTIPSMQVGEGDKVEVRESSRKSEYFKNARETMRGTQRPDWLSVDGDRLEGSVTALPRRDQMPLELNEQLVVEYYSR